MAGLDPICLALLLVKISGVWVGGNSCIYHVHEIHAITAATNRNKINKIQ
jgi:hypothetical protein